MSAEASCAYNESVSLELDGPLDLQAMRHTIERLVQRHESLRTVFDSTGMRVVVFDRLDIPLEIHDLSDRSDAESGTERTRIGRTLMTSPFDLLHGPLFRAVLFNLGKDQHVLRLVGHHAVCDGWSLGILMADISRIYSALLEEKEPELPEAIPHSRYAEAINTFYRSGENEQVKRYWKELFAEPIPRVDLPTDHPRPAEKTWTATRLDIPMDLALITGLKQVATRYGSSFVTTLLSVYEVLIARITGQRDLVIGLPAAGQSDMGMKDLVGHCVSLLPLRTVIDDELPFHEYLEGTTQNGARRLRPPTLHLQHPVAGVERAARARSRSTGPGHLQYRYEHGRWRGLHRSGPSILQRSTGIRTVRAHHERVRLRGPHGDGMVLQCGPVRGAHGARMDEGSHRTGGTREQGSGNTP
ncbi:MAG: hypothetical protein IPH53_21360 [Flavobacteriales bacterium]|nr:hypothetical protein [Flavobacteriales bacterium]